MRGSVCIHVGEKESVCEKEREREGERECVCEKEREREGERECSNARVGNTL